MPTIRQLTESMIAIWTESTPPARAGLVTLLVMCVTLLSYVGYWSAQPSYVNLQIDGNGQKISTVIDALEKKGIDYQLAGAGGIVQVNSRQMAMANLELSKINVAVDGGSSSNFGASMFESNAERHARMVNEKSAKVIDLLRKMQKIVDADVILNVPHRNPFERAVSKPSASVALTLVSQSVLTSSEVLGVASAVANSVEQLQLKDVLVTDITGRVYPVIDSASQGIASQKDYTSQIENELEAKALTQLFRMLGPGNASVAVSLEYDFARKKLQSIKYDKDGKVVYQETIDSEQGTGVDLTAAGIAGVTPNTQGGTSNSGKQLAESKKENLDSKYHVPETLEENENNTPARVSNHVSVVINDQAPSARLEDGSLKPDFKQTVENIVRNAVGFNDELGTMSVELTSFYEAPVDETVTPFDWGFINEVLRNTSLAIAAIVVLVLGMMTLRHFKSVSPASPTPVAGEQATNINQLNELARSNPEVFARILKSWAGDKPVNDTGSRAA